jgi:hypothetical protein
MIVRGEMSGCSLTEAFPDITDNSGKIARKEERKKAVKCGGPALSFLKAEDPDRMAEKPDVTPSPMKREEGFNASDIKIQADSGSLIGEEVHDVIGEKSKNSLPRATSAKNSEGSTNEKVPSYFGKSDDSFADFNPLFSDNPGYQIQGAGFGSFDKKGLEKATGQLLPTPALNNVWKPLTPSGAETSFFKARYTTKESTDDSFSKEEKQALLKKLDVLFARLDDLEYKKNDYAHTEVSLFILCGLFLLFGLESVRKLR